MKSPARFDIDDADKLLAESAEKRTFWTAVADLCEQFASVCRHGADEYSTRGDLYRRAASTLPRRMETAPQDGRDVLVVVHHAGYPQSSELWHYCDKTCAWWDDDGEQGRDALYWLDVLPEGVER